MPLNLSRRARRPHRPAATALNRALKVSLNVALALTLTLLGGGWPAEHAAAQTRRADAAAPAGSARTLTWDELVPKDWDPQALFRERPVALIKEGSAAERELQKEMREIWDKAPTRSDLAGQRIRLPGYVVPLDLVGDKLQEFLLVPYFGACIHSPPPPANQIVHVSLKQALPLRTMDVVWITGTLSLERQDTGMGVSGYAVAADRVEPYKADKR